MRRFLLVLLLLPFGALRAQNYLGIPFDPPVMRPCPGHPTDSVLQPGNWVIYQTTNGFWDGPIDTTRCIDASWDFGFLEVALSQVDTTLPLYVRAIGPIVDTPGLLSNYLYGIQVQGYVDPPFIDNVFPAPAACPESPCSGLYFAISIPDSLGNPHAALRWHTGDSPFGQAPNLPCVPTEKFPDQKIGAFFLKFSFAAGAGWNDRTLGFFSSEIYGGSGVDLITDFTVPLNFFNNDAVDWSLWNFGGNQSYVLAHHDPVYPGPQGISYVEGRPDPNTATPTTINLIVEDVPGGVHQSLHAQPFTALRGAFVEGSDSVRHQLNVVNNGGDLCIGFIDVLFTDGAEYQHRAGSVGFSSNNGCMLFRSGSALRVLEGGALHYGEGGTGMLALCANTTIRLERDATLVFDGLLNIAECSPDQPAQDLHLDLPPGARLEFTPQARITNVHSHGQQMKIRVRMLGGTLDDADLPADDRALLMREYPTPPVNPAENFHLTPNPVFTELRLRYTAAAPGESAQLTWQDAAGRNMHSENIDFQAGVNEIVIRPPEAAGLYLATLITGRGAVTRRVIRL